jgi:hypothetical protein
VRSRHPIADVLAHAYASDVLAHAEATLVLAAGEWPATAYVTARAAFEAAQDLAYLAATPSDYDRRAVLAYVIEMVETEELLPRVARANTAMGLQRGTADWSPERIVARECRSVEVLAPGHALLLKEALAEARKPRRTRIHWSGYRGRGLLGQAIAQEQPAWKAMESAGDAFYGHASTQSHPRLRAWHRRRRVARNRVLLVQSPQSD